MQQYTERQVDSDGIELSTNFELLSLLVCVKELIQSIHQDFLCESKLVQADAQLPMVHELRVVSLISEDGNSD